MAFPIYAFLLVQGFLHTHNIKKYILRLSAFAAISEIPFDLCLHGKLFEFDYQNVYFTLLLGLLALCAFDGLAEKWKYGGLLLPAVVGLFTLFTLALHSDYRYVGVGYIFAFYISAKLKESEKLRAAGLWSGLFMLLAVSIFTALNLAGGAHRNIDLFVRQFIQYKWVHLGTLLSFVALLMYNGREGHKSGVLQMVFYLFYPLHLMVIYLIYLFIA